MVAFCVISVVLYFLFGYFFLPFEVCATGWYFLGALFSPLLFFILFALLLYLLDKIGLVDLSKPPFTSPDTDNPEKSREEDSQHQEVSAGCTPHQPIPAKKMRGQVQKTVNFCRKKRLSSLPKEDILEYTTRTKEEIREYVIHRFNKKMSAIPGWDIWDISIHMASGQYERMERATSRDIFVMSYDPKYKLAKIQGKTSIYLTSCFRCSCPDYRKRRLPCKHMYALSERLGGNVEQSILDSEHAPLYGLTFALVGHLPRSRNGIGGIRAEIKDRGGICSNNIDFNSSAVVMGKNPSVVKVEQAENFDMEKLSPECIMEIFT